LPATILCVDDDRSFCKILSRALRAEDYGVEIAHDGETALAKLRECSPDLVTLDILLPKLDGFEVLEAIRNDIETGGQIPVLMLSGCTITPAYQDRADRLRADALLKKPVPLADILQLVAKRIEADCEPVRSRAQPSAATPKKQSRPVEKEERRRMPVSGSFQEVPFPALLHHLHGLRATGVLQLQSGKKKKLLQLEKGHPVAVRSNLVNETLGNLLVATGKINSEALHESVHRVKNGEGPQGQILIAMHMLDQEDLAAALRNQAEEKLFEIFSWRKGNFRFKKGARLRGANALYLKSSPANLIMDGVSFRLPMEEIDGFLRARTDRYPTRGESPFYRFQEINLNSGEEELLADLDGTTPLFELLSRDETTQRSLYGLITLELVELLRAPTSTPVRTSSTRRPAPAAKAPKRQPTPRQAPRRTAPPASKAESEDRGEEGLRVELTEMSEKLRGRDYFEILGVPNNARDEEIRKAYVDLAKRFHPDRFSGASAPVRHLAEEIFGLVSRAHETLSDRDRRLEYIRDRGNQARDAEELEEGHRALKAELEFQKGVVSLRKKSYQKAVAHFEKAVNGYPEEGEYHAYYGWALYLEDPEAPGRLKEALERVLQGRKLAPGREKPYLFLGRLYKAANRDRIAEKMFTRAVQLDPDCVEALRELRLLNMRRERSRGLVRRILRR
jgi:curved DNA-binding protein CbpA/CheY-like chemotaxis protein